MGVLIRKQKGGLALTGIARLSVICLVIALASSSIDTIWSVYLDSFFHNAAIVGFFSSILTLIAFVFFFLFIPLVEKSNKSKLLAYSLLLLVIFYLLFAINTSFYLFIILAIALTAINTLKITNFGIIVRDKSKENQLSRNEGLVYSFLNVAWFLGPLIAGFVANKFGIKNVFVLAAIFMFIAFWLFTISKIKDSNIKKKTDTNLIRNCISFFKDKKRTHSYIISSAANLWLVLIYLFMPLLIVRSGLNNLWIGYFLAASVIPLIMFNYHFAKLAGKYGFRKIFKIGFLILALSALSCFFISNIYLIFVILILSGLGFAMLEPTIEAYFFDVTNHEEECRYYGPYNTSIETGLFIGKIIPSIMLLFLPFKFIFLFFSLIMFVIFLLCFKIKNVIEQRKHR